MSVYLLQEDGSSRFYVEDSSGFLLQEFAGFAAPFIASTTAVHAPSLAYTGTNQQTILSPGAGFWLCPTGITQIYVECVGGGGGGAGIGNAGFGGGGGGAYAARTALAVTPGTLYSLTVGLGGTAGTTGTGGNGGTTTLTGDSSVKAEAVGGNGGSNQTGGAGGTTAASTGDVKHTGGAGGNGVASPATSGAGGGASANSVATGAAGVVTAGGTGANGGGSGGNGGSFGGANSTPGTQPGGGGGGGQASNGPAAAGAPGEIIVSCGVVCPFIGSATTVYTPALVGQLAVPFISSSTSVFTPSLIAQVVVPFISSATTVYALALVGQQAVPFIASVTVVYTPTLTAASTTLTVPFISSNTHVWAIVSFFDPNKTYGGPGNGGEAFLVELNANGVTSTATLVGAMGVGLTNIALIGDSGFPTAVMFVVTIDSEQILLFPRGGGNYSVKGRGVGNTTAATHATGSNVDWGDSYDQAIVAAGDIGHEFTANINSTGSFTYPGWLICFDSSQAYLSGDRYPMHVTSVLGVFDAGAGTGGTNRCDAAQPNAIAAPTTTSDYCPAALSNPSRIDTDIVAGDVAVVRYTNPEASVLDLGPRAVTLQSWFGLMRVSTSNVDVTFTDPNGIVVDTTGTYDTFTGSVNGVFAEPLPLQIGIAPDASDSAGHAVPTPNTVPWETVTLTGTDRKFTFGSGGGGYDRAGWPICCLAVRNGKKRVPFWQSWDWRDYSYIYTGFGTDAVYAQLLINRNGIVFDSVPAVSLPGPQDIDGPDAVWDDAAYFYGCSWYVVLFNTPYIVYGPAIGGSFPPEMGGPGSPPGYAPGVTFPPGGPVVLPPPFIEGGSGGNINPGVAGLHIWATSGKGFS